MHVYRQMQPAEYFSRTKIFCTYVHAPILYRGVYASNDALQSIRETYSNIVLICTMTIISHCRFCCFHRCYISQHSSSAAVYIANYANDQWSLYSFTSTLWLLYLLLTPFLSVPTNPTINIAVLSSPISIHV